ncbi:MAG: ADP-ribosylglycohydrolase family protein [Paramuribaculum sp.]|nr:ADP-ribosylglycohydrolase family protein [Paramuribaculum sp.]
MLGAIAGDIIGSRYEFTEQKMYDFELLPPGSRYTDDTVMTLAVAQWLLSYTKDNLTKEHLIECMQSLGRQYPFAGYGSSFNNWLQRTNPEPYGSWGNGAAMRVSPVGLYAQTLDEALELAKRTADVSHNHPEGIKGAQAVASAVWMAKYKYSKNYIRDYITDTFHYDLSRTVDDIRDTYKWDVSCQGSVPESIICFLEGKDFVDVVRLAVSLGGDADTMACIAGSIAACIYDIPTVIVKKCNRMLPLPLFRIMDEFSRYTRLSFRELLDSLL